ncbi:SseB family protein [Luteimicrobium sp. NPDC057192]|uniref:SseB family protein n=1 Tax=Luteimicrobium sp. NPDC057192 TaxID=3346042 RepID=UPI0036279AB9
MTDQPTTPGPSSALDAALVSGDRGAVGRALREGPVIVPHLTRDDGTPQVRVFPAPEGSAAPYEVCVFSSAASLAAFLGDDPGRDFSLRRRDSLAPFLRRHGAALERVVVDPAGPDPMAFAVPELLAALETAPVADDPTGFFDETGAGISPEGREALATTTEPGGSRGIGIELHLPDHWVLLDLDDAEARDQEIRDVVKRQTASLGDRGASLRRDLRDKMIEAATKAASAGGQVMAYLVLPGPNAALALNLTLYWHDLGPETDGVPHLRRLQDRLGSRLGAEDALTRTETLSGPFLRHVRVGRGAEELGAQDVPLLLVDYWAEAPGRQSVARLAFSTPHVEIREQMLTLTDKVLFATEWLMSLPGDEDTSPEADEGAAALN